MRPIRLVVIEDDPEVRTLLRQYLDGQPELICVMMADSVRAFLTALPGVPAPQVLLLDLNLPEISGLEALPLLKTHLPEVEVLLHTVFEDPDQIYQALCLGASGYVLKNTPLAQIKSAIVGVASGQAPLSRTVARRILGHFKLPPRPATDLLTAYERHVLEGIVGGLSETEIAREYHQSVETVQAQVKHIFGKLRRSGCARPMPPALRWQA